MEQSNQPNNPLKQNLNHAPDLVFSASNTIAVYTVLSILLKMRAHLGLEAMLEYLGKYLTAIETQSPKLKEAVTKALKLVSVEKIYFEVTAEGQNNQ